MNHELYEVIKAYATKLHKELASLLLDKSKDQLIALYPPFVKRLKIQLKKRFPNGDKSG